MRGEPVKSVAGVRSNADYEPPKVQKAMFVGGGFSQDELRDMMAIPEGKSIPWLAPDPERMGDVRAAGGPEKAMEMIVGKVKKCLIEHGMVEGSEDRVEVGLWWT